MKHVRTLQSFWNWLPAFRAVAETQHLPTASEKLFVSPSALSRTIRLLEDEVGCSLFERRGRQLLLAPPGEQLLRAVRDAMRRVHEGMLEVQSAQYVGPVSLAVPGPMVPMLILPALVSLSELYPQLIPQIQSITGAEANAALRCGALDVALVNDPIPDDEIELRRLLEIRHDVYCGPSDPLAERAGTLCAEDFSESPFVTPVVDGRGATPDAWPVEWKRQIKLRVVQMQAAVEAVRLGRYVAVLPDMVAAPAGLVPLKVEGIETRSLYLLRRPMLGVVDRASVVIKAIEEVISAL